MKNNDYYEPTIKTSRLETDAKIEQIYKRTEQYGRMQFVKEIDKLQCEKQQLISWLEDKIKEYEGHKKYLYEKQNTKLVEKSRIIGCIGVYKEVLDFVNKVGKDEQK